MSSTGDFPEQKLENPVKIFLSIEKINKNNNLNYYLYPTIYYNSSSESVLSESLL
jgi:hypothetical protein